MLGRRGGYVWQQRGINDDIGIHQMVIVGLIRYVGKLEDYD
jgi:hypothetical protein